MAHATIAIIGAGLSGTLLAINLLRRPGPRVVLIERSAAKLARGTAYATENPRHLLNVRASNMSAFPDEPQHFLRWLGHDGEEGKNRFVERRTYGDYIAMLLEEAHTAHPDRFHLIADEAVDAVPQGDGWTVTLAGGAPVECDTLVLATGNFPPADLPAVRHLAAPLYLSDPWAPGATRGLGDEDTIMLLGSGLTAVDVALSLDEEGFRGRILCLSRRGLRPRSHSAVGPKVDYVDAPSAEGSWLVRHVRQRVQKVGWRKAVDELRPHTQSLWRRMDGPAKRRFLRLLRPYWDAHRHRLAPAVDAQVATLQMAGRLLFAAGKIETAIQHGDTAAVTWRARSTDAIRHLDVRRIINCTGPLADLRKCTDPLIRALHESGAIRPDPVGIGIDVTADGQVRSRDGHVQPSLLAIGPLTRGEAWEVVAVPDIRIQVARLAAALCPDEVLTPVRL